MLRDLYRRLRARTLTPAGMIVGTACLLASLPSWGLGLGDIDLQSSLNEPLDAQIELLDVQGLQPTEVVVSLASARDFQRVGVERFYFLTDLRFEVSFAANGARHIKVFSTQPITEPYLNFLVEVLWPSGRMLKEYTLLLDPPTFSPTPAPAVAAPARTEQAAGGAGRVQRDPPAAPASAGTRVELSPGRSPGQSSPLDAGVVGGEYRMTDRSDTLWAIALRTRPSAQVSVMQNMLALQRLNPDAFLNGNINLLKAGYSLRLPSESEALAISSAQANEMVAMQTAEWQALRRGDAPAATTRVAAAEQRPAAELQSQVDATPARMPSQPAPVQASGELRIVASAGDGVAGGGIASAADERLNATLEEQDRLSREVEELNAAMDRERDLAINQLSVRDRQLEVRDQQIAQMQAEMERMREAIAAVAAQSQNQNASRPDEAWWQSPYVQGAAAGLVVLLLAYGLVAARRRRAAADTPYIEPQLQKPVVPVVAAAAASLAARSSSAAAAPNVTQIRRLADQDAEAPVPVVAEVAAAEVEADEAAPAGEETNDVIGEADIYIAYGRYPQAIGLLLGVLRDEPQSNDVRLKLLELYAETRDRQAFDLHMGELQQRCQDADTLLAARELSGQFGPDQQPLEDDVLGEELGEELGAEPGLDAPVALAELAGMVDPAVAPDSDLDGSLMLEPLASEEAERLFADELLELEDLGDLDELEFQPAAAKAPAAGNGAAWADDAFELELDDVAVEAEQQASRPAAVDDLGGDLGIDFDPDVAVAEQVPATADELELSDDETLDLELELDLPLDPEDALPAGDDDFGFGEDDGDTASTKLDLARAYIDMGDQDGARDILNEVVTEGNSEQQRRAEAMLAEL